VQTSERPGLIRLAMKESAAADPLPFASSPRTDQAMIGATGESIRKVMKMMHARIARILMELGRRSSIDSTLEAKGLHVARRANSTRR